MLLRKAENRFGRGKLAASTASFLLAVLLMGVSIFQFNSAADSTNNPHTASNGVQYSSAELASNVSDGTVSEAYAEKVEAGDVSQAQAEMLTTLDQKAGGYDEQSIVLQGTTTERAQEVANTIGATLRITEDGSYAQLTLADGRNIRDVVANSQYCTYVEEMEPDWHVRTAELGESDYESAGDSESASLAAPRYSSSFNDPLFSAQTYLDYINSGSVLSSGTRDVTIAVIDTGIDVDNPEFSGIISPYSYNASSDVMLMNSRNAEGTDVNWGIIDDEAGHGTSVSSVLAAKSNNEEGLVGLASGATLMVVKCDVDKETGEFRNVSDIVFGVFHAVDYGADVINLSLGGSASKDPFAEAI